MRPDPSLIDVVLSNPSGYPPDKANDDSREALMNAVGEEGATVVDFPDSLWIEPKDWAERARQNDENKSWALNFIDRFTNQGPGTRPDGTSGKNSHECTCHSLCTNFAAAWNRQRRISFGGPVKGQRLEISAQSASVWLSPLSVYIEANPGEWGGANVQQVLRIMARRGALPDKIQPREYGFQHVLHGTTGKGGVNQSAGPWVSLSRLPEGWQETAKHFRPLEFIFPKTIEQAVCLLLHQLMVSVGRNGHAVPWAKFDPEEKLFPYPDSYDVVRYDSWNLARSCVNGSFSILSTTVPDDWSKPAG